MKKTYSKPEFIFESFRLSASIATGCTTKITTQSQDMCGFEYGGEKLFVKGIAGCEDPITDNGTESEFCYHVPTAGTKLFNS